MRKRESGLTGIEIAYLSKWFPRAMMLEVRVHEHQWWLALFVVLGGGLGLATGKHIWCRHMVTLPFLAHELMHVHQQDTLGVGRFLRIYLRDWLKLRGRPISEHPLEEPAYRLQYEVAAKMRDNST